jgi:hypothetical protein
MAHYLMAFVLAVATQMNNSVNFTRQRDNADQQIPRHERISRLNTPLQYVMNLPSSFLVCVRHATHATSHPVLQHKHVGARNV